MASMDVLADRPGVRDEHTPSRAFASRPSPTSTAGFGVYIEDIVTVTEEGGRRLSNTTHDLRIVA